MIVFQNILFSKKFIACSGCFGSFTKTKKGLGIFFTIPFFLLKISKKKKKKCVIKFLFRQLMPSNNALRFIFVHPIKQWLTGDEKKGRTEIQNFKYLENEKSFFIIFEGLSFGGKNKK